MRPFTQNEPLTDAELDHLGDFLKNCKGGRAMNVEVLDGFFAALIAGPEAVMPSEYYREVLGGEIADTCVFASLDEANEIFGLVMRHWNDIAGTLFKGEFYVPLLLVKARMAWCRATTGLVASCTAQACAATAGASWSMMRSKEDAWFR
jgi:uncharacterized protein